MWDSYSNFIGSHFDSFLLWAQGALPFFIIIGLVFATAINGARKLVDLFRGVDEAAEEDEKEGSKSGAKGKARSKSLAEASEMIDSVEESRHNLRLGETEVPDDRRPSDERSRAAFDPAEAAMLEQMLSAEEVNSSVQYTLPFGSAETV